MVQILASKLSSLVEKKTPGKNGCEWKLIQTVSKFGALLHALRPGFKYGNGNISSYFTTLDFIQDMFALSDQHGTFTDITKRIHKDEECSQRVPQRLEEYEHHGEKRKNTAQQLAFYSNSLGRFPMSPPAFSAISPRILGLAPTKILSEQLRKKKHL